MPAHCKSVSRKNLLTIAQELGFGECGIISNEAASCISAITKFGIQLKEGERLAIITKKSEGLICYYWQQIGRQIKSYQKPFLVETEFQKTNLSKYLRKYANFTLIDANVGPETVAEVFWEVPHRIMKREKGETHFWSRAAILKAQICHQQIPCIIDDFLERFYRFSYNGRIIKEFDRPSLPFETNILLRVKGNHQLEVSH